MKTGEIRLFKIDIFSIKNCGLKPTEDNPNLIEIKIRKAKRTGCDDNVEGCRYFEMVDMESDVHLICKPGCIHEVKAGGLAQGCGISKLLIQLCLNEANIHQVNHDRNQAMNILRADDLATTKSWVKSNCEKIVYISNLPKFYVGSLYLKSAISSNYDSAFIKLSDSRIYPPEGATCTEELLNRYNGNGGMESNGNTVNVYQKPWFVCYPKEEIQCISN